MKDIVIRRESSASWDGCLGLRGETAFFAVSDCFPARNIGSRNLPRGSPAEALLDASLLDRGLGTEGLAYVEALLRRWVVPAETLAGWWGVLTALDRVSKHWYEALAWLTSVRTGYL